MKILFDKFHSKYFSLSLLWSFVYVCSDPTGGPSLSFISVPTRGPSHTRTHNSSLFSLLNLFSPTEISPPCLFEKGPLLLLLPLSLPLSYPFLSQPHLPILPILSSFLSLELLLSHPLTSAYPQLSTSQKPNFFLTFKPWRLSLELLPTCFRLSGDGRERSCCSRGAESLRGVRRGM